ncbi:GNAT family N-acetyltransferase [Streptomyces canus]|uniref:GNAT family N-acetyltransferase n=1 Tax=Streptomyces canus TaxID=58343 RepID=UPI00039E9260|nr:GNAT family N-acetyltransferase [Streptomyces canus]
MHKGITSTGSARDKASEGQLPYGRRVVGVVTGPERRRHGHGRTVVRGLLGWFRDHHVSRVELRAPVENAPLHRAVIPSR